jgi:hypothetical protein
MSMDTVVIIGAIAAVISAAIAAHEWHERQRQSQWHLRDRILEGALFALTNRSARWASLSSAEYKAVKAVQLR